MNWFTFLIALNIFLVTVTAKSISSNKLHSLILDKGKVKMSWLIDWYNKEVFFYIQNAFIDNYKWFQLGFSRRGDFERSDLCIFQLQHQFFDVVWDTYTSDNGKYIYKDLSQDCILLRMDDNSVAFKRKFDTCDPQDLRMHEGTMYILWARGEKELDFEGQNFIPKPTLKSADNGVHMLQLLRADKITVPENNIQNVDILLDNVEIPARETTYWCKIQKLPDTVLNKKHHIVQFQPVIKSSSQSFVHHMEVFHCDTDPSIVIPLYNGDCDQLPQAAKVCSKVISLWAMGASTFTYPEETGLPIGGRDYNPYIRIEVHFNNPDLVADTFDSSGMQIRFVQELRKYDAAVMELGLEYTDKMAIPPKQLAFPVSGYCIAECTKVALPDKGIIVFGSQLHTHLRGVRIMTRHFRQNKEIRELNRDDYYSHHFQEIRQLRHKPLVLPGDALVTTCYYDTRTYKNATLGGFSISDEMCVNYIHYYPATKLEVCKSSVSEQTLSDYFVYMKRREHQKVEIGGARSENYRSISWTKPRVAELYAMYIQEPLSMQCNRSDGNRFEGFNWEGAPITSVKIQTPYNKESCMEVSETAKEGIKFLEDGLCDMLGDCIY